MEDRHGQCQHGLVLDQAGQRQPRRGELEMHTLAKRLLPNEGDAGNWGGGLFASSSTGQDEGKEPSEANSLFSPEQTASLQGLTTLKDIAHTYHVVRTKEEQKQLLEKSAASAKTQQLKFTGCCGPPQKTDTPKSAGP